MLLLTGQQQSHVKFVAASTDDFETDGLLDTIVWPGLDSILCGSRFRNGVMTTTQHEALEMGRAAEPESPAIDVDQIIRELDAANDRFPEETLRACQENRELIIPRLINVLLEAARLGREGIVREGQAPFYALFLIGESQAIEALPALVEVLSLPNDVPEHLFDDAVTEILAHVLAALAANRLDELDGLILNPHLNDYVRSSASTAFEYLVRDQRIDRRSAVERLAGHLRNAISREDVWSVSFLICTLISLNGNEAKADIDEAFQRSLVDESYIDSANVDESLRPDEPDCCPELDRLPPSRIANVVEELRGWHWAADDGTENLPDRSEANFWGIESESGDELNDDFSYQPATTIRHESPRVGRNDLCPCGSGKKYKKCCMRNRPEV
jgi:Protein of unknown function (DUF1186)/SEC-C motif